jgi:putative tryptophan/tyrosine transport system substrate-binding protein
MRRREFLGALGGAALTCPRVAGAQQPGRPVIGYLRSTSINDFAHLTTGFRQGLKEAGFVEGENVVIEYRSAEDRTDRLPVLAAELASRRVSAIVANTRAILAAKAATATIPIVFTTGSDPVNAGFVANLNRPGGNVTGVVFLATVLGAKRLELLRQLVPKATTIAALVNTGTVGSSERRDLVAAAQAMGLKLIDADVNSDPEIEAAFATFVQGGAGALMVGSGAFLSSKRLRIVALAARHALPATYPWREAVEGGGLMSYGPSQVDAHRQAGIYVGRILKGEKAGDLPVVQSSKFEFVINLKTAKALGLEFHPQMLATADEAIE